MLRVKWTEPELRDLRRFADDWPAFSARHPNRSYDSFEVKRRRLAGGTAGSRVRRRSTFLTRFFGVGR